MDKKKKEDLSSYCKENCGLDVKQVAAYSEIPRRTLYDWWASRRKAVKLIVLGVKCDLNQ